MKYGLLEDSMYVCNEMNIKKICKEIGTSEKQENAFYVCDIGDIIKKYENWKREIPRVVPYYAVKCNDNEMVLKVLAALGANFDCASQDEIRRILQLGVDPDRIIFAHTTKPKSGIEYAQAAGVAKMTFDSEAELRKIKTSFPNAKAVMRIRYDSKESLYQLGVKYGCDPDNEAPSLLLFAKKLGINVIGISFHVGSGCGNPFVFTEAIRCAKKLFEYAKGLGYNFYFLDIGGGFPGDKNSSIKNFAEYINIALEVNFSDKNYEIIAEPGRYFVASALTLATNIHSIRRTCEKDKITGFETIKYMYYINDGIYTSFITVPAENTVHKPIVLKNVNEDRKYESTIWGSTCCPLDVVVKNLLLPQLQIGDWLLFENMGAYTICLATNFNGMPIPKVYPVIEKSLLNDLKILKNLKLFHV